MALDFRFAVLSDLHVGLPHTVQNNPYRLHLVELSIPALENVLSHLSQLDLDFLLVPGDLTQDGEPDNHAWLAHRLAALPFPAYVVPGNHDLPKSRTDNDAIDWQAFPTLYRQFGYETTDQLYYTRELLPGVRLVALNSIGLNPAGQQIGALDQAQLAWLKSTLDTCRDELVMVMVHHNVLEHIPNQTHHPVGRRYMLGNAPELRQILQGAQVQLVFTGHLHVQDIAHQQEIYDITTGSLVSYPHPYRIIQVHRDGQDRTHLQIESQRIEAVPGWPNLQEASRELMGDRSVIFMNHFLTQPPLNLPQETAQTLAPHLRYFWATIANGDPVLSFPDLPQPIRQHFESFSAPIHPEEPPCLRDNQMTLVLEPKRSLV